MSLVRSPENDTSGFDAYVDTSTGEFTYTATGTDPVTGAASNASSTDYLKMITDALPAVSAFFNAQQMAQINLARAQKGLAPLNAAAYGPQVGVSLNPQTQQFITYGLIGLAAFFLINKRGGSRR